MGSRFDREQPPAFGVGVERDQERVSAVPQGEVDLAPVLPGPQAAQRASDITGITDQLPLLPVPARRGWPEVAA